MMRIKRTNVKCYKNDDFKPPKSCHIHVISGKHYKCRNPKEHCECELQCVPYNPKEKH